MGFRYELRATGRPRIADARIEAALRGFARHVRSSAGTGRSKTGRSCVGVEAYDEWGGGAVCSATIIERMGTWKRALESVGLHGSTPRRLRVEDLIAEMERVWKKVGASPQKVDVRRLSRHSPYAFEKRWGTVRRCCESIAAYRNGKLTRAQLIATALPDRAGAQVSQRTRWRVFRRDKLRCVACGASPATGTTRELHVDHIVPASQGGDNAMENLRTLCCDCNQGRSAEVEREDAVRAGEVERAVGEERGRRNRALKARGGHVGLET